MLIKQISVFIENKVGKLGEVVKLIGENDVDIYALSLADTTDFGVLRLIVSDPEKTKSVLQSKDMIVKSSNVIAIMVEDKPGGLAHALDVLKEKNISIEYTYAFIGKNDKGATVVMKVDKPDDAVKLLSDTDVEVIDAQELYR